MLDQHQDQDVEGLGTTETQYSTIVHNVVSMLASLMHHQGKDHHVHLVWISHQLYPNFFYAFFVTQKLFSLLSLTLANLSYFAFILAV